MTESDDYFLSHDDNCVDTGRSCEPRDTEPPPRVYLASVPRSNLESTSIEQPLSRAEVSMKFHCERK